MTKGQTGHDGILPDGKNYSQKTKKLTQLACKTQKGSNFGWQLLPSIVPVAKKPALYNHHYPPSLMVCIFRLPIPVFVATVAGFFVATVALPIDLCPNAGGVAMVVAAFCNHTQGFPFFFGKYTTG